MSGKCSRSKRRQEGLFTELCMILLWLNFEYRILKCTALRDEHVLVESRELYIIKALFGACNRPWSGRLLPLQLRLLQNSGSAPMLRRCIKTPIQECSSTVLSRTSTSCAILKTRLENRKRLLATAGGKSSNASHTAAITARNERERQIIRLVEQRVQTRQILLEEVCPSLLHPFTQETHPLLV
jgi:hypothetical protein